MITQTPSSLPRLFTTERDIAWMWEVGEYGWFTLEMVFLRHFQVRPDVSIRYCQERIRLMTLHGLTLTHRLRIHTANGPRNQSSIVRLTEAGATLVEHVTGRRPKRWAKGEPPMPMTWPHRTAVVQAVLALTNQCSAARVTISNTILEYDTYPDFKPSAKASQKFLLSEHFTETGGLDLHIRPDAFVGLVLPTADPPGLRNVATYFEVDLSSEGSRFLAKIPAYRILLSTKTKYYKRHMPDADVAAVLVVCKSRERIANLQKLLINEAGTSSFRFAVAAELQRARLHDPIWVTVHGDRRAILSSTSSTT